MILFNFIMKEKFSLKDALFNQVRVEYLADLLVAVDTKFNKKDFVNEVVGKFPELELKDRIRWMAEVLERFLPKQPTKALAMIVRALPPELDLSLTDDDFGEFILAPLGEYVVQNGCTTELVEQALDTLYQITKRFSMEDAMRTFLNTFPSQTLSRLQVWVSDNNYHVRRLVSESTRPMLPWSARLKLSYQTMLPFLDVLYADRTRYVTRSVANHLNDIAKKDPELVVSLLAKWKKEGRQNERELQWMTRHALRILIKKGHTEALSLIGFSNTIPVTVERFCFPTKRSKIAPGDILEFSCILSASHITSVLVDYVIDFKKANGTSKPKVFKWKQLQLKAGETMTFSKRHTLKADATTFKLYPGLHTLTIQINGIPKDQISFTLL